MIRLLNKTPEPVIALEVTGRINGADYESINPFIDKAVSRFGKINLLMEIKDLEGFTPKAAWEEMKEITHLNDFNKVAIVGDKAWREKVTEITDRATPASVRYFDARERAKAVQWVEERDGAAG